MICQISRGESKNCLNKILFLAVHFEIGFFLKPGVLRLFLDRAQLDGSKSHVMVGTVVPLRARLEEKRSPADYSPFFDVK
jgi:hypothetical protein